MHDFGPTIKDGRNPLAGLVLDGAGNLYGTTNKGGKGSCVSSGAVEGCGTVFEISPKPGGGWSEKILNSFVTSSGGYFPKAGLTLDAAGNLYGTASSSSGGNCGTVFELSPTDTGEWTAKTLHDFNCAAGDGAVPVAGVTLDAAGNLYGTTSQGGAYNSGIVFQLTPSAGSWTESVLHTFGQGTDGATPYAGVIFDAFGNLYGTTYKGGNATYGTAFELTPATGGVWTETVLHNFGLSDTPARTSRLPA